MSMRVTQRQLYGNITTRMGNALSALVDSNLQSASQKRINRPSDDAVGMTRVLNYRTSLESIAQYQKNVNTANGWLKQADGTLLSVSTELTRAIELAEEAATGTMSADNRKQVSYELRQIYEQMIQMANNKYGDDYIFAGHKSDEPPFRQALTAMSGNDGAFEVEVDGKKTPLNYTVTGGSATSMVVQFLEDGEIGGGADIRYRYSSDGGATWTEATLTGAENTATGDDNGVDLKLGGVTVRMHLPKDAAGNTVAPQVKAVNPDNVKDSDNGSWLYVYPTAEYLGDDQDAVHMVSYNTPGTDVAGVGYFTSDVTVRIDARDPNNPADAAQPADAVKYSYSLDGGRNWVEGNWATPEASPTTTTDGRAVDYRLSVPGGYLELGTGETGVGAQHVIKPQRANIDLEIAKGETITINNVGKDVFGGIYKGPNDKYASTVFGSGDNRNLFEILGRLIAYTENNSQQGVGQCVEDLREVDKFIQTKNANIGGRENRLAISKYVLQTAKDTETEAMSNIEDIDLFELTTRMSQQQIALQSVLQSSSMIMQMSLLNFI